MDTYPTGFSKGKGHMSILPSQCKHVTKEEETNVKIWELQMQKVGMVGKHE